MITTHAKLVRELDSKVALQEGKKHQAPIGDVREIRKIILAEQAQMSLFDLAKLLDPYRKKEKGR